MKKDKIKSAYYSDSDGSSIAVNVFATEDEDRYAILVDRHPVHSSRIEIVDQYEISVKDIDRLIEQYARKYNHQ